MLDPVALHQWYQRVARTLPWREDPRPYYVLLSEFMCQQTRVATALPYFERFRARWPTLSDLAAVDVDEVVEAWAGLGYYSRARRLHAVAVQATAKGGLPSTAAELLSLDGIGPYTAGAIASIAFGEAVPAVDGNVNRVLARHNGLEVEVDRPEGKRQITALAAALHGVVPPGDLNQALMELGATVCTPRKPRCEACPVADGCIARQTDRVQDLPRKRPKKAAVRIEGVAGVLEVDGEVLLVKKAGKGLLGGLWSPPFVMEVSHDDKDALVEAFSAAGVSITGLTPVATVRHIFSHRDLLCRVYRATGTRVGEAVAPWSHARWSASGTGMSSLASKIVQAAHQPPLLEELLAADD